MNSKEKFILRALIRWNKKEFIKKNCFSLKLIQQSSKIDNDELNYTISEFVIPPVKVDKCIFDVIPSSFQTMNSTQDFMTALRLVYRNKYLESERNNIITHGFRLVKQLNSISIALKNMYEKHSQHKDPIINKKALLKIGQVCEHIVHGYRGVVVGWTIDEATSQQEVTLLLDTSDYSEFLDSLMTVDHEKLRRLSLSEARLVSDDDLLRISNAALFSGYFTKFDLSLKRYIPKKELQFCFPMDFKDNSEQKRRNGRFMNAKRSTSKDQLNKQESLEEVRKSLLALCKDLLDIIRLYPISQSLLDLSLEESREGEITEIDRVTFPAVAETILDLTSIVGHLQTKDIASSYRGSIAKIPLWGPKVYGSKSVRQINPGPDLATLVYEACEMLSITYKHLEKTLQFRLQQHGIGHIDDLLSVYSPTSGTARRTIDFELEYASALRSEKELNEVISVPISKTSRPAGKSNFAVISAVPEGLEIVDTTVTPPVHFSVGQVVLHKMYGYRAVIYGYDQRPTRDVSNWSGVKNLVHRDNQPFYWVFPDEDDLQKSWGSNQMYSNLYAAQENLQLMTPSSSCPVRNRYIKSYFGGYNATSGEFDLKGSKLRFQFPRALASPPMTEGTVNNSIPPPQQVNELHAGDAVAQNLLLHLLAAMKRSFNESRIGGVNHQLIDNFPRLRKINKLSSSDLEKPILSLSDLLVLLRTAETTTEAKNVDLLISDIHGAHDSSDICKALRLANLSIIRKKPEEEAINLLKKVILMDTRFSVAHTLLSALHHNRNAYKESIWWAKEAIKQDPTQFNAYRPMAVSQEHLIELTDSEVDAELSVRKGLQMHPWQSNMSTMLQLLRRKRYAKKATLAVRNLLKANVKAAIEHASKNDPRSDFDSKSKASNVPRSDSDSDDPSDVSK